MSQLKPIRIPNNTKISRRKMNSFSKILSLLNIIKLFSNSFILYLICCVFICNISSFGVNGQQKDSDGTIPIPYMKWMALTLDGPSPPGLRDFAFGILGNLAVIFGGTTPGGVKSGETYLIDFDSNAWKRLSDYAMLTPNPQSPEARSNMIFGVDKSSYRNAFIISGGQGSGDTIYNDTWAFDFVYKQWTKIERVTGEIPPMYGSFGGIDTTLATSSQTELTNTLWASHGTDGKTLFTDLYALVLDGTLSPNLQTMTANWSKVPSVSGNIPAGRSSVAGTILPNKRLVMYGGCDKFNESCATADVYSLDLGSNYSNGKIITATPFWSKKNSCLGARLGAAITMNNNPNTIYKNLAIVYGGSSPEGDAVGPDGEIGVLDADLGNWVRVIPQEDPVAGFPFQRAGAQMIPIPRAIGAVGIPATDILLFGGESLKNHTNLNDLWILRLYTNSTSGELAKSDPTPMKFLSCIQTNTSDPKSGESEPGTETGDKQNKSGDSSDSDFSEAKTPKEHVTFSTLSYACLPLAASVVRFGYGSNRKFTIVLLYTIFIVASYATAFYGFAISFQDKSKSSGHFASRHGMMGLALLVIMYILVPLMAISSLCVSKKYESDSISNDDSDSDNGKGGIGSKLVGLFQKSESNSNPVKAFEVSRPGNRLALGGEVPPQLPMVKKTSDNWMETRKSVTIAESHPTMSSQGSRNNSLQNSSTSQGPTSNSNKAEGSETQTTPSSNQSHSTVIITRHIHHIFAQFVLLLTAIFIGASLATTKVVDSLLFYVFIGFVAIIYLIWILAAWYGYPKGRNSLLVYYMHKIARGKGETNETKEYNFDHDENHGTTPTPQSPNRTRVRVEDDDMDEEAEQAQLEQDMHNREVVVMTIPKRRLTVVNA